MVQDPLSAIGARIEARLNAQSVRFKSVEETVRAQVEANRPAEFTLLPDGTKQFGYAPVYAEAPDPSPVQEQDTVPEDSIGYSFTTAAQDAVKAQFISLAPTSSWDAGKPQLLADSAPAADDVAASSSAQIAASGALPVIIAPVAPVEPTPVSITSAPSDTSAATPAATASAAENAPPGGSGAAPSASTTPAAASVGNAVANAGGNAGFVMLADGTKQFGYAPTGPVVNLVRNVTPPVPASFGPGATFRIHGLPNSAPMTVTRGGDGVVFAMYTDSEGTREMAFMPNQLDLVTAAPN